MSTIAAYMQMGMRPAAGGARLGACTLAVRPRTTWQLDGSVLAGTTVTKQVIADFVDSPDADHRHRRPWGTS